MAELKLAKLPDRTPVKYAITVPPALNKRLIEYTAMYNEAHKDEEPEKLEELIPYILDAFLDSDRAFARRLKQQEREGEGTPSPKTAGQGSRRGNGASSQSPS